MKKFYTKPTITITGIIEETTLLAASGGGLIITNQDFTYHEPMVLGDDY